MLGLIGSLLENSGGGGSSNDKGYFVDEAALTTAYPTGEAGWFAVVGSTDTFWIWDTGTSAWVNSNTSSTGDVVGPNSSIDSNIVLFDGTTGKLIKDGGVALSSKQNTLVSGTNIKTINGNSVLGSGDLVIDTGAVDSVNGQTGIVVLDADDISDSTTTNKFTTAADISKLAGIEAGAQVNNISDVNATDLTDGGNTTLHIHDSRYYTESEIDTLLSGKQNSLGFTPENVANKENATIDTSTTKYPTVNLLKTGLDAKQNTLVSGTNIKTINSQSVLGSGNIEISVAFDKILSGANTGAEMIVVSGSSLAASGTGTIAATSLNGSISSTSTATTQSQADNSTKVATTAYVDTGLATKLGATAAAGGDLSGNYPNPAVLNSAVLAKLLTGLNVAGGSIEATDSLIQAFGKIQNQLNAVAYGAKYIGTWNASTNNPTLSDATGTQGNYYVVSVAGTQNLGSGNISFEVGDWAIHNGTIYQKVDNTDAVISVNGLIGAVVLNTSNVSEVTNLYFTTARVLATALTGFTSGAGTISASDTILQAIQKLDGNVNALSASSLFAPSTSNAHQSVVVKGDGSDFEPRNALPSYTTTERDALVNVPTDFIIFNETTASLQKYNGTAWANISSGSGSGTLVLNEIPSGIVDGTNNIFELANVPTSPVKITQFDSSGGSGIPLLLDIAYSVDSSTITFLEGHTPQTGTVLRAEYGTTEVATSPTGAGVPTGSIVYALESKAAEMAVGGFIPADGSVLSQSAYPSLYAAIGLIDDRGTNFANFCNIGVDQSISCIISNETKIVVVANGVAYSANISNLNSWTTGSAVANATVGIYANGLWVLIGNSGVIYTSSDGVTFTQRFPSPTTTQALWDIVWTGTNFVISGAGGIILISSNGTSWSTSSTPTSLALRWLATNGSGIVVCKLQLTTISTTVIIVSTNHGATWSAPVFPLPHITPGSLVFGNYKGSNLFIMKIGQNNGALIYTSSNGVDWTLRDVSYSPIQGPAQNTNNANKVRYDSTTQRFYTAFSGNCYSTDMANWKTGVTGLAGISTYSSLLLDSTYAYMATINGYIFYAPMTYSYNTSTHFKLPRMDTAAAYAATMPNLVPYIKT